MSEKPKILIIGGTEQDREKLLDEIFEKLNVMNRDDLYFHVKSTSHPWGELILSSLASHG
jgi:hypothetical protein